MEGAGAAAQQPGDPLSDVSTAVHYGNNYEDDGQASAQGLDRLLHVPGPKGTMIQMYVKRSKGGGLLSSSPRFELFLKDNDSPLARATKKDGGSYIIASAKDPEQKLGKLKVNMKGNVFSLVDSGANCKKLSVWDDERDNLDIGDLAARQELCSISHSTTASGSRSMVVSVCSSNEMPSSTLVTKPPQVIDESGKKKLDFNGRVTLGSVKNFQLVPQADSVARSVTMQFGRVGKDAFNLDYSGPLSGLQAFGIALTVFGHTFAP